MLSKQTLVNSDEYYNMYNIYMPRTDKRSMSLLRGYNPIYDHKTPTKAKIHENRKKKIQAMAANKENPWYGPDGTRGILGPNQALAGITDYLGAKDLRNLNMTGHHFRNKFALSSDPKDNREMMNDVNFKALWDENIENYYFTLPMRRPGKPSTIIKIPKSQVVEEKTMVINSSNPNPSIYETNDINNYHILKVKVYIERCDDYKHYVVYDWKYPVPTFDERNYEVPFDETTREWLKSTRGGDEWLGKAKQYTEKEYEKEKNEYDKLKESWKVEQIREKMPEFVNTDGSFINFEDYFVRYKNILYKSAYFEEQQGWFKKISKYVEKGYEILDLNTVDETHSCAIMGGSKKRTRKSRKSKCRKKTKKKAQRKRKRRRRSSKRRR